VGDSSGPAPSAAITHVAGPELSSNLADSATGNNHGQRSDALDNADFPFGTVAQSVQRGLVGGAVMSCDSLLDTFEFKQNGALLQAELVNLRRLAAQKAPSAASERRTGELAYAASLSASFTARYTLIQ
jgi:hypothetical protein